MLTMGNYFGFFTFGKIFDYAKIPYVYSAENKQLLLKQNGQSILFLIKDI